MKNLWPPWIQRELMNYNNKKQRNHQKLSKLCVKQLCFWVKMTQNQWWMICLISWEKIWECQTLWKTYKLQENKMELQLQKWTSSKFEDLRRWRSFLKVLKMTQTLLSPTEMPIKVLWILRDKELVPWWLKKHFRVRSKKNLKDLSNSLVNILMNLNSWKMKEK